MTSGLLSRMTTSGVTTPLTIRQATADDAARFTAIAESTFVDTFGPDNTPADVALYCAQAFSTDIQRGELLEVHHTVLFAEKGDEVVGYAMLRVESAPACVSDPAAIEIVRLYAASHLIGMGIGRALMQRCLDLAAERGHRTVWLGVWERNARAIAFYENWGFIDVGTKAFVFGTDHQTDRVMMRTLLRTGRQGATCAIP